MKDKSTRRGSDVVEISKETITPISPHILIQYRNITLGMDFMKVNKISFFTTISRVTKYVSATELKKVDIKCVLEVLKTIVLKHRIRNFGFTAIAAANALIPLLENDEFLELQIILNLT